MPLCKCLIALEGYRIYFPCDMIQPDPDIIVRPSGEYRLSNFLTWQSAYSEFWFSDILWPDFTEEHVNEILYDFQNRNRRFGGV